jgi:hypothetical protein
MPTFGRPLQAGHGLRDARGRGAMPTFGRPLQVGRYKWATTGPPLQNWPDQKRDADQRYETAAQHLAILLQRSDADILQPLR